MPYRALATQVIQDWRVAERELAAVDPDSADAERLRAEIERLRQEYHRLLDEQAHSGGNPLDPFPPS
jgi:hypothetical protein